MGVFHGDEARIESVSSGHGSDFVGVFVGCHENPAYVGAKLEQPLVFEVGMTVEPTGQFFPRQKRTCSNLLVRVPGLLAGVDVIGIFAVHRQLKTSGRRRCLSDPKGLSLGKIGISFLNVINFKTPIR